MKCVRVGDFLSVMDTPGTRLRDARKRAGFATVKGASMRAGVGYSTYAAHENGQNDFGADQAAIYARIFGVSPSWLLYGVADPFVIPIHEAERNGGGDDEGPSFGAAGGWQSIPGSIPEIDASPGAGEGTVGETVNFSIGSETYSAHRVSAEWFIPPETLTPQFGMVSEASIVMKIRGDSMEPTFRSGDPVGVDLRVRSFDGDGIYVFSEPGEPPKIKRLQKVPLSNPKAVRIISDNKAYETDIVEISEIIIHGRVGLAVFPK